jgi:hypothetical protein
VRKLACLQAQESELLCKRAEQLARLRAH